MKDLKFNITKVFFTNTESMECLWVYFKFCHNMFHWNLLTTNTFLHLYEKRLQRTFTVKYVVQKHICIKSDLLEMFTKFSTSFHLTTAKALLFPL